MPLLGELMAIGSALAWSFTSVAMRPVAGRALWRSSLLRMIVCAALLAVYAWPSGALQRAINAAPLAWLLLLGSTICTMGVGDSLYFLSAARIGVARALPIAAAFPLLTTAGAVLVLHSVAAAVGTLASASMFLGGITYAGVARGVALNATSPVFSAILAALLLGERVSRRVAIGVAASVIGTILLVV